MIGWEALITNLNKHAIKKKRDRIIGSLHNNINIHDANNEVNALKGKCRSWVDYQSVGKN